MVRRLASTLVSALALLLPAVLVSPAAARSSGGPGDRAAPAAIDIDVTSGPSDQVSGDDARLRLTVPPGLADQLAVLVNGEDQTDHFSTIDTGVLDGVVDDLDLGSDEVTVVVNRRAARGNPAQGSVTLVNHPITGPDLLRPPAGPVLLAVESDYDTAELDGPVDDDCSMETTVSFKYRTTAGAWADYDPDTSRPADMATTTTMNGDTVDYIVRWERGTINRFIYSLAMLSPESQDVESPDLSAWNKRLFYYYQGGVAVGHYQGDPSRSRMVYNHGLGLGYAVAYSTGTKTSTHYSYPDMTTQTIHVGDCELLERWMDFRVLAGDPTWANWENRTWIEGMAAWNDQDNNFGPAMPPGFAAGASECINAWRGQSPLVLNPNFGTAEGITPAQQAAVEWTHYADAINVYGRNADGFANNTWSGSWTCTIPTSRSPPGNGC